MDTQTAIDLLNIELVGLNDEIARDTKRAAAYQIAIDQLNAVLTTQLTALATLKNDLATALQDPKQPDDKTRLDNALALLA